MYGIITDVDDNNLTFVKKYMPNVHVFQNNDYNDISFYMDKVILVIENDYIMVRDLSNGHNISLKRNEFRQLTIE